MHDAHTHTYTHTYYTVSVCNLLQLEASWVGPNITIPFLRNLRQQFTRDVEIVCKDSIDASFHATLV